MSDHLLPTETDAAMGREGDREDAARRASELAHRALQESVDALQRAARGRLDPGVLDELQASVDHARHLVATAQMLGERSRGAAEAPAGQSGADRHAADIAERASRGFVAMVTWGRRNGICGHCRGRYVVAFRCSTQKPTVDAQVPCPWPECAATVACEVPASAYAFQARMIHKRQ